MADGPVVGLARLDQLGGALDAYHLFHAARADLLRRARPPRPTPPPPTAARSSSPARSPNARSWRSDCASWATGKDQRWRRNPLSAARSRPPISGITVADATREGFPLTFVNDAFLRLTGYARDEVMGRNCRFLQGPDTDPSAISAISSALRDGREATVVLRNYRKDGTDFYNELRLAPVLGEDGGYAQVIGVQNDVSALVRAERSLRRATRVIAEQDQELAELRVLQRALTPAEPPARPRLELASCFLAAEDGVAGDFDLVAPGPGDATVFVVGDVIGHGLEAARRATFLRTALATFCRFSDDPSRLLEMANHALIERSGPTTEFVTAVCATYRPDEQALLWASAWAPAAGAARRPARTPWATRACPSASRSTWAPPATASRSATTTASCSSRTA